MPSNSFGSLFRITTFGESHGPFVGVVLDGCPAGLAITKEEIDRELSLRSPGKTPYTSPRKEKDEAQILSGVFKGKTTGAPIALLIANHDADSSKYEAIQDLLRPGHANFTYLEKYGIFDYRGAGRASARETAARVAAGAIAKKLIGTFGIRVCAFVQEIGGIAIEPPDLTHLSALRKKVLSSPLFCPDQKKEQAMIELIRQAKKEGDSLGGILEGAAIGLPAGLGDPIYQKLEADLASAMLSIPASKGFEIGAGFESARMKGSTHNDAFALDRKKKIKTSSNFAGGILGGISTGSPLFFKVAFKPTSSIQIPQKTVSTKKKNANLALPNGSRHDPCVAIRAVPVVEAMLSLVLADALLRNRLSRLNTMKG